MATPPAASPFSHPAFHVNISSCIKTTLETEKGDLYTTWSELFKIHARAYQVLDHILPPVASSSSSSSSSLKKTDPDLWSRLDAIVLQWIYSTISNHLLQTIIQPDSTAEIAWNRLKGIFAREALVRLTSRAAEILNDVHDPRSFSDELVVFDEWDNRYLMYILNHDTGTLMMFHVNSDWEIYIKDFHLKQGQVFQISTLLGHELVPGRFYYTLKPFPADHSDFEKGSVLSRTLSPQDGSVLYIDASEASNLTNYDHILEPSPTPSSEILFVCDENNKEYTMLLSYCAVNVYAISGGWGRFARDHNLKPGDRVFFYRYEVIGKDDFIHFYDIKYIRKEELEMTQQPKSPDRKRKTGPGSSGIRDPVIKLTKLLSAHQGNIVWLCFDASEALLLTGCSLIFENYPSCTVLMTLVVYDEGDRPYDMVLTRMKRDDGEVICTLDGGWHRFVEFHGLKAGDKVTINRIQGELCYVLSYTRAGLPSGIGESGVGSGGSGQNED